MIISKYSKSYDTADGSEQQFKDPEVQGEHAPPQIAGPVPAEAAGERWEDDGGSLAVRPPLLPKPILSKPPWSVLPLDQLNEAIRLEQWADNPAHAQRRAEEAERRGFARSRSRKREWRPSPTRSGTDIEITGRIRDARRSCARGADHPFGNREPRDSDKRLVTAFRSPNFCRVSVG